MPPYTPSKGAQAPAHIREQLLDYLGSDDARLHQRIIGQLWNCTDTLLL